MGLMILGVLASAWARPWPLFDDPSRWEPLTVRETEVGPVSIATQRIEDQDCVQGVLVTEVPMRWLDDVVADTSGDDGWRSTEIVETRMLHLSDNRMDFYQVMDVPDWTLLADRWWLLTAWTEHAEANTRRLRWQRVEDPAAYATVRAEVATRFPGVVEMPVNWGEWVFVDEGAVRRTTYRVCTDLGGSLPRWIQRIALRRSLPDNLVDLVREARRRASGAMASPP